MSLITSKKISKVYLGSKMLYSSGNVVTYHVDSNTNTKYTEEFGEGENVLSPKTFVPYKSGWTFVGWRKDKTASSSTETSMVMGDEPITLYAVFRQTVTVSYYQVSDTTRYKDSKFKYYNNGNYQYPKFTISPSGYGSEWTFRGWTTNTAADASVSYSSISNREFTSDVTLYVLIQRPVTLKHVANGSTGSETKYVYLNSYNGNTIKNPTFTVSNPSKSGATFKGWSTSSGNSNATYEAISNREFSSDTTVYAVFKYNDNTIYSTAWSRTSYQFEVPAYSGTLLDNSSLGNYSQASFTVVGRMWCTSNYNNYVGGNPTMYVTVNGSEATLLANGSDILYASDGVKSNSLPYTVSLNGSLNITLRTKSGVWAAHGLSYDEDDNVDGEGWAGMTYEYPKFAVTLTGKTIVG